VLFLLLAYNLANIVANGWLFHEMLAVSRDYSWKCQPVDYSDTGLPAAKAVYAYYLLKGFELLDSVFFLLRGGERYHKVIFTLFMQAKLLT